MWVMISNEDVGHTRWEKKDEFPPKSHDVQWTWSIALGLSHVMFISSTFLILSSLSLHSSCATMIAFGSRSTTAAKEKTFCLCKSTLFNIPHFVQFCPSRSRLLTSWSQYQFGASPDLGRRCAILTNLFAQCLKTTSKVSQYYTPPTTSSNFTFKEKKYEITILLEQKLD